MNYLNKMNQVKILLPHSINGPLKPNNFCMVLLVHRIKLNFLELLSNNVKYSMYTHSTKSEILKPVKTFKCRR